MCNWGDTSEIQAKGLVVSELAKVIMDKVLDTMKTPDQPIPGITSMSLVDKTPRTLVPMKELPPEEEEEECDDLPFEGKQIRPVKGFREYARTLNETVAIVDMDCQKECINYCLDRIKKEVGSYDPDEIFKVASKSADPRVKARVTLLYVKDMVIDYLSGEKAQMGVVTVNGNKGKDIPKEDLDRGLDQLYHDIADAALVAIEAKNGLVVDDGEAE